MNLSRDLRELARSVEGEEAPVHVEAALLNAYRMQNVECRMQKARRRVAFALAAGVVLVAGSAAWLYQPVSQPYFATARIVPPSLALRKSVRHSAFRIPHSALPKAPQSAIEEVATAFIPLQPADDLRMLQRGTLMRVRMPRAAMVSLGLPVQAEDPLDRVQADILLGEDGMARAIRFVQPAPRLQKVYNSAAERKY